MSNLTSVLNIDRGWPNASALQYSFKQKAAVTPDIVEGEIVAVENEGGIPVVDRHTSALDASGNLDHPWLVHRGRDESDAVMSNTLACVKLRTGVLFRVATTEAPLPGSPVYADAGALTLVDPGSAPLLGRVTEYNPLEGVMIIES